MRSLRREKRREGWVGGCREKERGSGSLPKCRAVFSRARASVITSVQPIETRPITPWPLVRRSRRPRTVSPTPRLSAAASFFVRPAKSRICRSFAQLHVHPSPNARTSASEDRRRHLTRSLGGGPARVSNCRVKGRVRVSHCPCTDRQISPRRVLCNQARFLVHGFGARSVDDSEAREVGWDGKKETHERVSRNDRRCADEEASTWEKETMSCQSLASRFPKRSGGDNPPRAPSATLRRAAISVKVHPGDVREQTP